MIWTDTLPPDVGCDDDRDGQEGQPPAGGGVAYRVRGQVEADEDDDGPGDHRRQEAHDLLYADQFDDGGQNHIEQAGHYNAAAGVLELDGGLHCGIGAGIQGGHGGEAAQIGERGAQKGGYLQAGANMEEEGADARRKTEWSGWTGAGRSPGPEWGPGRWHRTWRTGAGGPAPASWAGQASGRHRWARFRGWICDSYVSPLSFGHWGRKKAIAFSTKKQLL